MVSGLCPEAENVAECEEAILILFKSVFRENGSKGLKLDGLPLALPDLCLEFIFLRHFLILFMAFLEQFLGILFFRHLQIHIWSLYF